MSDDLERDLRTMLAVRAGDVVSVPERLLTVDAPDAEVLELGLRRADILRAARRRWPLLLAAAAVVAILTGVLTALHPASPRHTVPPATHVPSKPVPTVQRETCVATDAASWNRAVRASSFTPPGFAADEGIGVDAVLANGDAVVTYNLSSDPKHELGTDLGVLAAGSRSIRDLGWFSAELAARSGGYSLDVDVDGSSSTAVVAVDSGRLNGPDLVRSIYAVDLDTGHRVLLAERRDYPHQNLTQGYLLDGVVYWQADPTGKGGRGSVYSVPVSGGTAHAVAHPLGFELGKSAVGIEWTYGSRIDRPAAVPAVVAQHAATDVDGTFDSFVSDGTAYAWADDSGALQWYSPHAGHVLSFPGVLGAPGATDSAVLSVAGPLVFFQAKLDRQLVLDTRSGALLHITSGGTFDGASDGTAIGEPMLAGPRHAGTAQVMRLDTQTLAQLQC